ncbi:hypothetical protein O181_020911 [Austropuccinia psidii MF-1]|uniref:Uncharacterized protein n=1 Tax=Austropuccinia psidii MF-1 TaxID=1389203 RepID=A0A9Q3GV93_9BASI|nr:hypothetical protein [Austropuccinia psidii MF-1]
MLTSIGSIIKEVIIPHRKGNLRLNPEFVVLGDAHIQGFLFQTYYQRMYGIHIYSIKKQSLLKILRKNRPAFSLGEEPLGTIRFHDTELDLELKIPYPPIRRRPLYPERLEARKEIEKYVNELLNLAVIRKIQKNEIGEVTKPVLITWNDGKFGMCGDYRALNN